MFPWFRISKGAFMKPVLFVSVSVASPDAIYDEEYIYEEFTDNEFESMEVSSYETELMQTIVNQLVVTDLLLALIIGCICAAIFGRYIRG